MRLAEWEDQYAQKEVVVFSLYTPNPLCEVVADIILGKVDGVEIRDFHAPALNTYSVTEW